MIFVTVGTHEQQFNRLIKEIDELKGTGIIKEDVFIQKGFSTYEPKNCTWSKLISYEEMNKKINEARIIITHGGPASFISCLNVNKIPIVVPRQKKFEEHINDHQVDFAKKIKSVNDSIIPVYNIEDLRDKIINYENIIKNISQRNISNNEYFCLEFEKRIKQMIGE